jgi:hypothetical protein
MKTSFLIVSCLIGLTFNNWINRKETQDPINLLNYNIIGIKATQKSQKYLDNQIVQKLLFEISEKPRDEAYVRNSLANTNISLENLIKSKILKRHGNSLEINIMLFTKTDQYKLRELTEYHAKILSNRILVQRKKIEELAGQYKVQEVDKKAILYMIIGCFALDWDGLRLTEDKGLRTNGKRSLIYAWEPSELTKKSIYCGSHNSIYGELEYTSFGDHESQPRIAIPDIFWNPAIYNEPLKTKIEDLLRNSSSKTTAKEAGSIIISLYTKPLSLDEISTSTKIERNRAAKIVDLLLTLKYITQKGDSNFLNIPVLTSNDANLVKELRILVFKEMQSWIEEDYPKLQKELSLLTPFRYGLKQEDFFYDIWHDIFGATNRILVETGLFSDPYSTQYFGKGYIPFVFDASLYKEKF